MSVTKVEATLDSKKIELKNKDPSIYSGSLTAPKVSGDYELEISAYDDAGNVFMANPSNTKGMIAEVSKWHTPKTNWMPTDRFNFADYNRIKNNLVYLNERVSDYWKPFNIEEMGADIESYESYWDVNAFNLFERNLETININMFTQNYGIAQRFFENGAFIQWQELNRIESAILNMNSILERQKDGFRSIPFRFGAFKEVRI